MKQNRTRAAIADAYTHLLHEHTIEKITVKMITDEVGCSRKTFYYYFTDVYDLTRYVCDQRVQAFMNISGGVDSVRNAFLALVAFLNEDRPVILNMFHGYGKEELERFTWQATEHYTRKFITHHAEGSGISEENLEAVIHMYAYMLFGMLVDWVSHNMDSSYEHTLDVALNSMPYIFEKLRER